MKSTNENLVTLFRYVLQEVQNEHPGKPSCLVCTRILMEFLKQRGIEVRPLVVRGVAFNAQATKHIKTLGLPLAVQCDSIANSMGSTGALLVKSNTNESSTIQPPTTFSRVSSIPAESDGNRILPFRTIGIPHDNCPLGTFTADGWYGHLVAVSERKVIDISISQLNDGNLQFAFVPPFLIADYPHEFFNGGWTPFSIGDHLVSYKVYSEEESYLKSKSWVRFGPRLVRVLDALNFRMRKINVDLE